MRARVTIAFNIFAVMNYRLSFGDPLYIVAVIASHKFFDYIILEKDYFSCANTFKIVIGL